MCQAVWPKEFRTPNKWMHIKELSQQNFYQIFLLLATAIWHCYCHCHCCWLICFILNFSLSFAWWQHTNFFSHYGSNDKDFFVGTFLWCKCQTCSVFFSTHLKFWFCFLSKPSFVLKQTGFFAFVNMTKKLSIFLLFRKIKHFVTITRALDWNFPKYFDRIDLMKKKNKFSMWMNFLQTKKSPTSLKSPTVFNIEIRNIFNFQIGSRMQPPKKNRQSLKKGRKLDTEWIRWYVCWLSSVGSLCIVNVNVSCIFVALASCWFEATISDHQSVSRMWCRIVAVCMSSKECDVWQVDSLSWVRNVFQLKFTYTLHSIDLLNSSVWKNVCSQTMYALYVFFSTLSLSLSLFIHLRFSFTSLYSKH